MDHLEELEPVDETAVKTDANVFPVHETAAETEGNVSPVHET